RVGDVADTDVALLRGDDLARLHAAAALDQLAVESRLLEIADPVGNEMCLIDRHGHRVDRAPRDWLRSPRAAGGERCTSGDDRECRTSADIGHYACSFSLPATFSSAPNTASP